MTTPRERIHWLNLLDELDRLLESLLNGNQVKTLLLTAQEIETSIQKVNLTPFQRLDASISGIFPSGASHGIEDLVIVDVGSGTEDIESAQLVEGCVVLA